MPVNSSTVNVPNAVDLQQRAKVSVKIPPGRCSVWQEWASKRAKCVTFCLEDATQESPHKCCSFRMGNVQTEGKKFYPGLLTNAA